MLNKFDNLYIGRTLPILSFHFNFDFLLNLLYSVPTIIKKQFKIRNALNCASVAEPVDALDSKSSSFKE